MAARDVLSRSAGSIPGEGGIDCATVNVVQMPGNPEVVTLGGRKHITNCDEGAAKAAAYPLPSRGPQSGEAKKICFLFNKLSKNFKIQQTE